jgi:ubiquinone biosynthesis O-methyltransferase
MKKVNIEKAYNKLHRENFIKRLKKFNNDERKIFEYKLTAPWHTIAIEFLNEMNLNKKMVLEVGCGYGSLSVSMAKKGAKVTGIDLSKEAIKISKRNALLNNKKVIFKQAKGEKIPFKNNTFDFVLCCETLEHIPNYKKAIDEISRVTKDNGIIIITIPNSLNPRGFYLRVKSKQPFENFFNYWTIISEFKKRGVKIIKIKTKSFLKDYDKKNFLDRIINKTLLKYLSLRVGFMAIKNN